MLFQVFVQYIEVGQQLHGTRVANPVWQYVNNPALALPCKPPASFLLLFLCFYQLHSTISLKLLFSIYIPAGDDLHEADAMTSFSCDLLSASGQSWELYGVVSTTMIECKGKTVLLAKCNWVRRTLGEGSRILTRIRSTTFPLTSTRKPSPL